MPHVRHRSITYALLMAAALFVPAVAAQAQLAVLETDFGPAFYEQFSGDFFLDGSTRPSTAEAQQFISTSGLDAVMSNGQFISEVATEAPSNFSPPYYNPFGYGAPALGGLFVFAPATSPLEIDTAALNAAVMANAAKLDTIRFELLQQLDGDVQVVASGEKKHFEFNAFDFGSGVAFQFRWIDSGFDAASWHDPDALYSLRLTLGNEPPTIGACCINGGCLDLSEADCRSVSGTFLGLGTSCAGSAVLETDFGPAFYEQFSGDFFLDGSTRPSTAEAQQFISTSGLDAVMSNGQFISEVATEAPSNFSPPYYNPFGYGAPALGGLFVFAPATSPLEIDTAALNAAVMANAAKLDTIRFELLQQLDGDVQVVASGGKKHFEFNAFDFGSGVAFQFRWIDSGFDAASWHDPDALYAIRLTVGGEPADCPQPCPGDLNNDGAVDVLDLLEVLSVWGPCL